MDARAQALLANMAQWRLFVVLWHGHGRDLSDGLAEHLDYMIGLEKAGRLFASGPLGERARGDGLTILRADTIEEARALAAGDPFARAGVRTFTVEPWTVMEGRMTVSVDLSDRGMRLS